MNKEEIEALIEMRNNCLNASVYDDEKRLLKLNAITRALMLEQENKQLKEKLNTYESPDDMTLMFMWCNEKAKDKIKELTQVLLNIKEYIKEKRKNGEIFYINEVEKMINIALGDNNE